MRNKRLVSITLTVAFMMGAVNKIAYGMNIDEHLGRVGYGVNLENKFYTAQVKPRVYYSNNSEVKVSNEELYNKAYELTTKAIKEKSQVSINEARVAIEELKGKVDWAIGELSKQVDGVQNEIIVNILEKIDTARIAQSQSLLNIAINSIPEDMPEVWRQAFQGDIDKIQQKIVYKTLEAVLQAKESKTEEDINNAGQLLGQLQNIQGDEMLKNLIEKTRQDFLKFVQQVQTKNSSGENKNENKKNSDLEDFLNAIKTYQTNKNLKELFDFEKLSLERLQKYCKGEKFFTILRNIVSDINKEKVDSRSYLEEVVGASITKNILKDRTSREGIRIEIEDTNKKEIDITNRIESLFKGLKIDYESIEYGECRGLIYENKKIFLERDCLDYSVGIPVKLLEDSSESEKIYVTVTIKEDEREEDYLRRLMESIPQYLEVNGSSNYLKEEVIRIADSYLDERVGIDAISVIKGEKSDSLIDDTDGTFKLNEKTYDSGRLGVQEVEVGIKSSKGNMVKRTLYLLIQPEERKEEDGPLNQLYFANSKNQWNQLVKEIIKLCGVNKDISTELIDRVGQYICYNTNWVNMKKLKEVVPKINGIFDLKQRYSVPVNIEINGNKKDLERAIEEQLEDLKKELGDNSYDYKFTIKENNKNNFITIKDNEIILNKNCDMSYNVSLEEVSLSISASKDYKEGFNIKFIFHKEPISDLDRTIIYVKLCGDEIIKDNEAKKYIIDKLKELDIEVKKQFEDKVISYIKDTPNVKEENLKAFIKSLDKEPGKLEDFKEFIYENDWNKYKGTIEDIEEVYKVSKLDISGIKNFSIYKHFDYNKVLFDLNKRLKNEPLEDKDKTQGFIDEFIRLNDLKLKLYDNPIKLEFKEENEDINITHYIKVETQLEDIYDISKIEGVQYPIKEIKDEKIIMDKEFHGKGAFKILVKFEDGTYEKEKGKTAPTLELEVYLDIVRKDEENKAPLNTPKNGDKKTQGTAINKPVNSSIKDGENNEVDNKDKMKDDSESPNVDNEEKGRENKEVNKHNEQENRDVNPENNEKDNGGAKEKKKDINEVNEDVKKETSINKDNGKAENEENRKSNNESNIMKKKTQ